MKWTLSITLADSSEICDSLDNLRKELFNRAFATPRFTYDDLMFTPTKMTEIIGDCKVTYLEEKIKVSSWRMAINVPQILGAVKCLLNQENLTFVKRTELKVLYKSKQELDCTQLYKRMKVKGIPCRLKKNGIVMLLKKGVGIVFCKGKILLRMPNYTTSANKCLKSFASFFVRELPNYYK